MSNCMRKNLETYFPFIAEQAVGYFENGSFELLIELNNGSVVSYDEIEHSIRYLPQDSNNLTEAECKNEFGIRLNRIMRRKGITQFELSEMTGITQPAISNYMTGKTTPSFYNVDKIAKALDCSIEEFRYIK